MPLYDVQGGNPSTAASAQIGANSPAVIEIHDESASTFYITEPIAIDVTSIPGIATPTLVRKYPVDFAISGHRVVVGRADGRVRYADPSTLDDLVLPLWVTLGAADPNSLATVLLAGQIDEPSWSWTPGRQVYLGSGGALTQALPTAPTARFLGVVGVAIGPTTLVVEHHPSIALTE